MSALTPSTSVVSSLKDKASNAYNNLFSNTTSPKLMLFIILSIFVLIFVILYSIVKFKKTQLISKTFIKEPVQPSKEVVEFVASENQLPVNSNGKEYSYSFWIYVDDLNDSSNHNLIFLKTGSSSLDDINFKDTNVIAYIEKDSNKLKLKFRTANADQNNVTIAVDGTVKGIDGKLNIKGTTDESITLNNDMCYYSDFTIDYLPLQRWVNISIIVDNNLISVFMDGEQKATKVLSEAPSGCESKLTGIISNKSGNIFIGSDTKNNLQAFKGTISRFIAFNYAITMDHVATIYKTGAIEKSVLSKVGLPLYGVRNPLYRVDSVKVAPPTTTTI